MPRNAARRVRSLDRHRAIIYIATLPQRRTEAAGEKASPIHRKARGVDRRAATAGRGSQAQGREGQS